MNHLADMSSLPAVFECTAGKAGDEGEPGATGSAVEACVCEAGGSGESGGEAGGDGEGGSGPGGDREGGAECADQAGGAGEPSANGGAVEVEAVLEAYGVVEAGGAAEFWSN